MINHAMRNTILSGLEAGPSYEVDHLADRLIEAYSVDRDFAIDVVLAMVEQGFLVFDDNLDVTVRGRPNGRYVGSAVEAETDSRAA